MNALRPSVPSGTRAAVAALACGFLYAAWAVVDGACHGMAAAAGLIAAGAGG